MESGYGGYKTGCFSNIIFLSVAIQCFLRERFFAVEHLHPNRGGAVPFSFAQLCVPSLWLWTLLQNSELLVPCGSLTRTFAIYSGTSETSVPPSVKFSGQTSSQEKRDTLLHKPIQRLLLQITCCTSGSVAEVQDRIFTGGQIMLHRYQANHLRTRN